MTNEVGVRQYFVELHKLIELLFHEEIYWKQRAKIVWLAEGHANTKFIHATTSTRRKTYHISYLITDEGTQIFDIHKVICEVVVDYFKTISTEDSIMLQGSQEIFTAM